MLRQPSSITLGGRADLGHSQLRIRDSNSSIGFDSVLAQDHNHLTAASAQTLNLLENDFFLPILVGFALFGILAGLAVVVGRILPAWMGWVMFAFGLATLAGPIGFFCLLATLLWVLVAGIWIVRQVRRFLNT